LPLIIRIIGQGDIIFILGGMLESLSNTVGFRIHVQMFSNALFMPYFSGIFQK